MNGQRHLDVSLTRTSLFEALLAARRRHGGSRQIVEDPERSPLTYDRLVLGSLVLGRKLAALSEPGRPIGVMLPNVQGVGVVIFGLGAHGRVPAMLNFTAGLKNIEAACDAGRIDTIVTSRRFVDQARLEDVVTGLAATRKIVWIEDVRKGITTLDKLIGLAARIGASLFPKRFSVAPDETAVLLFTSGSEGAPKGVALSHANLMANIRQIEAHIGTPPLGPGQVVLNPLPVFHSYGLTGGLLLGLFTGMKVVLYPSPLHYRQIPRLARDVGATILFGTDTFLQGYARAADPGDLDTIRIVVAGAERVRDETRRTWSGFGTTILEGYGATECAPVIAANQIEANRAGTVGRFLPGVEHRLEPVAGLDEGGRLFVRGPNVMKGYMRAGRPGEIEPPSGGWHDTGDIVSLDVDGFVTIRGRAKRFAKLGGEMVSLAAVEALVQSLWPGFGHVVVAIPDPRKGEQLVLVTEKPDAERDELARAARAAGYPELWVPRAILVTEAVPVLGSGKIDYPAAQKLAASNRPLL